MLPEPVGIEAVQSTLSTRAVGMGSITRRVAWTLPQMQGLRCLTPYAIDNHFPLGAWFGVFLLRGIDLL